MLPTIHKGVRGLRVACFGKSKAFECSYGPCQTPASVFGGRSPAKALTKFIVSADWAALELPCLRGNSNSLEGHSLPSKSTDSKGCFCRCPEANVFGAKKACFRTPPPPKKDGSWSKSVELCWHQEQQPQHRFRDEREVLGELSSDGDLWAEADMESVIVYLRGNKSMNMDPQMLLDYGSANFDPAMNMPRKKRTVFEVSWEGGFEAKKGLPRPPPENGT